MHEQARRWIARWATAEPVSVLDIGGRDINGSPRPLFPAADPYVVLDAIDGEGVDICADAATWVPSRTFDVVLCAEVLEHTAQWRAVLRTCLAACRPGGRLILTTAAPGRLPHSGIDGLLRLLPGEHYANIRPAELERVLLGQGWRDVTVDVQPLPHDVRAVASKNGRQPG